MTVRTGARIGEGNREGKRLRILTVTNTFPRRSWSMSSGLYIAELIDALRGHGVDSDILVIRGRESVLQYAMAPWRILRARLRTRYDLIHAHHGLTAATVWGGTTPVVVTFHGSDLNVSWQRAISTWAARRASARITVSDRLREELRPLNAEVIPCGVDTSRFQPRERDAARRELGLSCERRYLLFPGSPTRMVKNYPLFQRIVERLRGMGHDVLGLAMNGIPPARVPILMAAVDALVLTSRSEGSPQSVKEALAVGLPIVATDVGDIGWLTEGVKPGAVIPGSVDEFARTLDRILRSQERSDGRKRIEDLELDWGRVGARVRRVYDRVLSSVHPPADAHAVVAINGES